MVIRQLSILPLALAVLPNCMAGLSLIDKNPFIWPGFVAPEEARPATPPASTPDFEFHAVYELDGITRILLRDRRTQQFQWLTVGEEADGLLGKRYDPANNEVLVSHPGGETTLSLRGLPEATGPAVAATPVRPVARPATTAGSPAVQRRTVARPPSPAQSPGQSTMSSPRTSITPTRASTVQTGRALPAPPTSRFGRPTATNPGVREPSFIPGDPGPAPTSEPPSEIPVLDARTRAMQP